MAKFRGKIGYGETTETSPGVWVDTMTERTYSGDVTQNKRNLQEGERINDDISVQNSISVVADAYAEQHFFAIRYVEWAGTKWKVSDVEVQRPRLILRLGVVWNGNTS